MKKIVFAVAALFVCQAAFAQVKNWNPPDFLNVNDGVLIYGVGYVKGISQINFDKKPAYLTPQVRKSAVGYDYFYFDPVEKGSRWVKYEYYDDKSVSLAQAMGKSVRCNFVGNQETLETVANPFAKNFSGEQWRKSQREVLDVPNDKKIVCWLPWEADPDKLYENVFKECGNEKRAKKYCKTLWEYRKKALEFALSKYKDTEWEPAINQEMDYVVKEYENVSK